jgi:Uma2 family endonuclease
MAIPLRKDDELFTYEDYLNWPDEERWELIEGIPFDMSPAPSRYHQEISMKLGSRINRYIEDKKGKCKVYAAPFDVRLPEEGMQTENDILSVVQPDISVICEPGKLDDRGCIGAPDFIAEIISPHTAKKDMKFKLVLYEKHGVPEYWIIYPDEKVIMVYKLNEQKRYDRAEVYEIGDTIPLSLKDGTLAINLDTIF